MYVRMHDVMCFLMFEIRACLTLEKIVVRFALTIYPYSLHTF